MAALKLDNVVDANLFATALHSCGAGVNCVLEALNVVQEETLSRVAALRKHQSGGDWLHWQAGLKPEVLDLFHLFLRARITHEVLDCRKVEESHGATGDPANKVSGIAAESDVVAELLLQQSHILYAKFLSSCLAFSRLGVFTYVAVY